MKSAGLIHSFVLPKSGNTGTFVYKLSDAEVSIICLSLCENSFVAGTVIIILFGITTDSAVPGDLPQVAGSPRLLPAPRSLQNSGQDW